MKLFVLTVCLKVTLKIHVYETSSPNVFCFSDREKKYQAVPPPVIRIVRSQRNGFVPMMLGISVASSSKPSQNIHEPSSPPNSASAGAS